MNWIVNPPIGTYITLFGFLAMIVTIWPQLLSRRTRSKPVWLAVFVGLTCFEINNL
jgi:hypothetical protein